MHGRRVAIRILVMLAVFGAAWLSLRWGAQACYGRWLPGVPDSGQKPIELLPWLFWVYESGSVNLAQDSHMQIVWMLACASLAVPSAGVWFMARGLWGFLAAGLASAIQAAYSIVVVWEVRAAHVAVFDPPPTFLKLLDTAWPPTVWACGLVCGGLLAGLIINRVMADDEI